MLAGDSWDTAANVLRLATQVVEGIQRGVAEAGFDDVRPVHGFVFVRLSETPATTAELAQYLGITKQATSELVHYLEQRGYIARTPHQSDRRAYVLELTARGAQCTRAAERAAARTIDEWNQHLPPGQIVALHHALSTVVRPGRLRPNW